MTYMPKDIPTPAVLSAQTQTTAVYDARDLTRGAPTAHLDLDGQIYTLRITRSGKLILTK